MKAYRFLTGDDDAAFCHKVTQALNLGRAVLEAYRDNLKEGGFTYVRDYLAE